MLLTSFQRDGSGAGGIKSSKDLAMRLNANDHSALDHGADGVDGIPAKPFKRGGYFIRASFVDAFELNTDRQSQSIGAE